MAAMHGVYLLPPAPSPPDLSVLPPGIWSSSCVCSELGELSIQSPLEQAIRALVPNGNIRRGNSMQEANYQPSSRSLSVFLALRLFCCSRLCIRHSPHGSLIYWQVQGPKGAPHHKAKHVLSSLHVPAGRWVSALHIIYFL